MLKSKIRQLKKKDTKKGKAVSDVESLNNSAAPSPKELVLSPPDGAENKDDGVTVDTSQEGQIATDGKKKRKIPKKKENGKEEGDKVSVFPSKWSVNVFLSHLCLPSTVKANFGDDFDTNVMFFQYVQSFISLSNLFC